MNGDSLTYGASLITFTFGAILLSALTWTYWWERRRTPNRPRGTILPLFTSICAVAFIINLALARVVPDWLSDWLLLIRALTTGLLAPLALHLVIGRAGRRFMPAIYGVAGILAVVRGLEQSGFAPTRFAASLALAPALMLGLCSTIGLIWIALQKQRTTELKWDFTLLALLASCMAAALSGWNAIVAVPDYLLLALLAVTLYYRERLMFFDVLVKRGAFFAAGLSVLSAFALAGWTPWTGALILSPLWLAGPWLYSALDRLIDRYWLRRHLSPADAERQFIRTLQSAAGEAELQALAAHCLSTIFEAPAAIDPNPPASAPSGELHHDGGRIGAIILGPRRNGLPYMSDDRRLLGSLANTLTVLTENVRFRQREQELRGLASGAELKALRAQINPHFLFNALNAIAGLIQEHPQQADETIEHLAHVFRYTLRKSANEWVPLAEEVEFVMAYLRVEQARFGARLRVDVDLDPSAAAVPIPAMSVQPLVENAVKHGVSAIQGQGRVGLSACVTTDGLRIEVSDNGPGFHRDFTLRNCQDGHGLKNVADRLAGLFGGLAALHWVRDGSVTRVGMTLPAAVQDRQQEAAFDSRVNR